MRQRDQEEFAAVWEAANAELARRMAAAFERPGPWRDRIRAALDAALRFLSEDEERARLYVAEVLFAEEDVRRRRQSGMERLSAMIDRGRAEAGDRALPSVVADGVAGGVWHCVHRFIRAGHTAALPEELPQLMYFVVLPYLGLDAALEELRRPPGHSR
jgi:hypothetical protein